MKLTMFKPALMTVLLLAAALIGFSPRAVSAQETAPPDYNLFGITHIYQSWNNCGPATLTMALTYYNIAADQNPAAQWLKPNYEDKNVTPWELVEYVNTQLPGNLRALVRHGGNLSLLKTLIANDFPVVAEAGYDPPNDPQGWMGHYLFMSGYDDAAQTFYTQDSFEGPNYAYAYDYFDQFWRHFNRLYVVVYEVGREADVNFAPLAAGRGQAHQGYVGIGGGAGRPCLQGHFGAVAHFVGHFQVYLPRDALGKGEGSALAADNKLAGSVGRGHHAAIAGGALGAAAVIWHQI